MEHRDERLSTEAMGATQQQAALLRLQQRAWMPAEKADGDGGSSPR